MREPQIPHPPGNSISHDLEMLCLPMPTEWKHPKQSICLWVLSAGAQPPSHPLPSLSVLVTNTSLPPLWLLSEHAEQPRLSKNILEEFLYKLKDRTMTLGGKETRLTATWPQRMFKLPQCLVGLSTCSLTCKAIQGLFLHQEGGGYSGSFNSWFWGWSWISILILRMELNLTMSWLELAFLFVCLFYLGTTPSDG